MCTAMKTKITSPEISMFRETQVELLLPLNSQYFIGRAFRFWASRINPVTK